MVGCLYRNVSLSPVTVIEYYNKIKVANVNPRFLVLLTMRIDIIPRLLLQLLR